MPLDPLKRGRILVYEGRKSIDLVQSASSLISFSKMHFPTTSAAVAICLIAIVEATPAPQLQDLSLGPLGSVLGTMVQAFTLMPTSTQKQCLDFLRRLWWKWLE